MILSPGNASVSNAFRSQTTTAQKTDQSPPRDMHNGLKYSDLGSREFFIGPMTCPR
jgi:hypothetical protein